MSHSAKVSQGLHLALQHEVKLNLSSLTTALVRGAGSEALGSEMGQRVLRKEKEAVDTLRTSSSSDGNKQDPPHAHY